MTQVSGEPVWVPAGPGCVNVSPSGTPLAGAHMDGSHLISVGTPVSPWKQFLWTLIVTFGCPKRTQPPYPCSVSEGAERQSRLSVENYKHRVMEKSTSLILINIRTITKVLLKYNGYKIKRSQVTTKKVGLNIKRKPFIVPLAQLWEEFSSLKDMADLLLVLTFIETTSLRTGKEKFIFICLDIPRRQMAPRDDRWTLETGLLPVDRVLHHQHLALIPRPLLFLQ